MKKNFLFVAMLLVALSFGFVSCDMINGNDPDDTTQDGSENVVEDEKQDPVSLKSVDLGLSVKWANCNVGATKPEDCGDYFAWGEVVPKTYFDWSNYKWVQEGDDDLIKYFIDEWYGNNVPVDNKTVLEATDDAASVNMGGHWRMPTIAEVEELINGCIWTWTTLNGVEGYEVKSKTNDNSIFLPAAGGWIEDEHGGLREECLYWASSLAVEENYRAWSLNAVSLEGVTENPIPRYYGLSVRGVIE
ncbi:MAG: hypothetical protein J6U79_01095 [Paludibacteraceae bacterium]|nr:hypothetical protein [Paludibacteraceae bacterium]